MNHLQRFEQQSLEQSVPKNVYKYILEHNLYKEKVNEAWSVAKIKGDLLKHLNKHRYEHTLGVADTAVKMAEAFNINTNQAYLAGILHDCAKYLDDTELLAVCAENEIKVTQIEQKRDLPRLDYLRDISTKDLDLLVKCILENMMEYLKSTGEEIEEHTLEAYNYYKEI